MYKVNYLLIVSLFFFSCKKTIEPKPDPTPEPKELQLSIAFDSLRVATGNEIANGPFLFDFNGNGRYDIIVNRNRASRTATSYTYELLNPIVILDDKRIVEITNVWKGGTTSAVADFNGDGYKDIAVMDNGPEFWDLNPNPPKTPLRVYWNNRGTFDGSNTFVKEMTNGCFNINSGDVDKDGKFEIIPMGDQLEDFSYEFDGSIFIKTEITHLKNISHTPALYGDFDKNGSIDIFSWAFDISGQLSLAKPTIIHNAASPTSYFRVNLPENYYVNLLLSGDFDKNGFVDFILIGRKQGPGGIPIDANHYLYYIENKGGANYISNTTKLPEYIIPAFNKGYPMLYTVQDFDGDGDLDFYNVNSALNIYFLNNNGNFTRWIR